MGEQLPILQIVVPLVASPFCVLLRRGKLALGFAVTVCAATFGIAVALLVRVLQTGVISYALGGWAAPWGIEYRIDELGAFMLFLVSGIGAVVLSFELLPPAGAGPVAAGLGGVAALGGGIFEVAVRLAAPFTAVMLVTNLAVGMLGRAIPQLNLMSLQLPAQIAITLLLLALGAGPFTEALAAAIRDHLPLGLEALVGAP